MTMTTGAIRTTLPAQPVASQSEEMVTPDIMPRHERRIMSITELTAASENLKAILESLLMAGIHYGTIPGIKKPTLYLPGAVWLSKAFRLAPSYEILPSSVEDWQSGVFSYSVRCSLKDLITGDAVAEGLGNCNSMEEKYRWRYVSRTCPSCGAMGAIYRSKQEYGGGWYCNAKAGGCGAKFGANAPAILDQPERSKVQNTEPYNLVNTILKMAKKRSFVDAVLTATGAATLFTQDLEDFIDSRAKSALVDDNDYDHDQRDAAADPDGHSAPRANGTGNRPAPAQGAAKAPDNPDRGAAAPSPAAWERYNNLVDEAKDTGLANFDIAPSGSTLEQLSAYGGSLRVRVDIARKYYEVLDAVTSLQAGMIDNLPPGIDHSIDPIPQESIDKGDPAIIAAETARLIGIKQKLEEHAKSITEVVPPGPATDPA